MNFYPISRQPDDFQQPLTAAEISAACRAGLGNETIIAFARELGSGLFNNTYLIETASAEQFILRVAPRETAAVFAHELKLLQREQALEAPLRQVLGDLAPRTVYADFGRQIIDRDFVVQIHLPGVIWDDVKDNLSLDDVSALWSQMADIATAIHQVRGGSFGLPYPRPGFARNSEAILSLISVMHDNLQALGLETMGIDPFLELLQVGRPLLDQLTSPRLVHGDLWPKNVLIDARGPSPVITGLLDAERGYWGDPLSEWIFYYLDVPDSFWNAYGRPPDDPATQFRRAVYHGQFAIQLLLEAYRFQWDPQPFHEQLRELGQKMEAILKQE